MSQFNVDPFLNPQPAVGTTAPANPLRENPPVANGEQPPAVVEPQNNSAETQEHAGRAIRQTAENEEVVPNIPRQVTATGGNSNLTIHTTSGWVWLCIILTLIVSGVIATTCIYQSQNRSANPTSEPTKKKEVAVVEKVSESTDHVPSPRKSDSNFEEVRFNVKTFIKPDCKGCYWLYHRFEDQRSWTENLTDLKGMSTPGTFLPWCVVEIPSEFVHHKTVNKKPWDSTTEVEIVDGVWNTLPNGNKVLDMEELTTQVMKPKMVSDGQWEVYVLPPSLRFEWWFYTKRGEIKTPELLGRCKWMYVSRIQPSEMETRTKRNSDPVW